MNAQIHSICIVWAIIHIQLLQKWLVLVDANRRLSCLPPLPELGDEDAGSHYVKNPQRGEKMRQRSGAVGMLSRIKSRSREILTDLRAGSLENLPDASREGEAGMKVGSKRSKMFGRGKKSREEAPATWHRLTGLINKHQGGISVKRFYKLLNSLHLNGWVSDLSVKNTDKMLDEDTPPIVGKNIPIECWVSQLPSADESKIMAGILEG